jgi:hypothetical protein
MTATTITFTRDYSAWVEVDNEIIPLGYYPTVELASDMLQQITGAYANSGKTVTASGVVAGRVSVA